MGNEVSEGHARGVRVESGRLARSPAQVTEGLEGAAAPIAGQNIAVGLPERARETFSPAIMMGSALMALFALWLLRREVSSRRDLALVPVAA